MTDNISFLLALSPVMICHAGFEPLGELCGGPFFLSFFFLSAFELAYDSM